MVVGFGVGGTLLVTGVLNEPRVGGDIVCRTLVLFG